MYNENEGIIPYGFPYNPYNSDLILIQFKRESREFKEIHVSSKGKKCSSRPFSFFSYSLFSSFTNPPFILPSSLSLLVYGSVIRLMYP